jgi:hypothetical protein
VNVLERLRVCIKQLYFLSDSILSSIVRAVLAQETGLHCNIDRLIGYCDGTARNKHDMQIDIISIKAFIK